MTSEARAEQIAREIWDVISGDCFGMTPDPWVCSGDCQDEQHRCSQHTQIVAKHILAALRAERAEATAAERQRCAGIARAIADEQSALLHTEKSLTVQWEYVKSEKATRMVVERIEVQETPRET